MTVTNDESGVADEFRLVMGSTVGELEDKISEKSVIYDGDRSSRVCFTPRHDKLFRWTPEQKIIQKVGLKLADGRSHARFVHDGFIDEDGQEFRMQNPPVYYRPRGSGGKGLGKGDIGIFVANNEAVFNRNMPVVPATESPGNEWLLHADPPSFVSPEVVSAVARACGGSQSAKPLVFGCDYRSLAVVTPAACQALRQFVECAHANAISAGKFVPQLPFDDENDGDFAGMNPCQVNVALGSCETDFKLLLSPTQLLSFIGSDSYRAILAALECSVPDAIAIRRTVATGRFIAFHTDHAARTVQVPLTHDTSCIGGRLLFACTDGQLLPAQRREGCILVHDGDAVHGVTRLIQGVRYGLYALRSRA